MSKYLRLSVHQLVDFLLRTGDIDNRVFNASTMAEGTRIHSYYQQKQGNEYLVEYHLSHIFYVDDYAVEIEGRADGIIVKDNGVIIDEIKSTISPLKEFFKENKEWHLGQAKCYALMYAIENNLESIGIQLTYIHQLDDSKLVKKFNFATSQLETEIHALIKEYIDFHNIIYDRTIKRNQSAKELKFPYGDFRTGQRRLAKYSYSIAKDGGIIFAEAPTGIGKTISTLYPAVKSFAVTDNEKIFYLTAKNSGRNAAYDATKIMLDDGLVGSTILITAKDKVCFCPGKACNPDECPFAKGYYTKIKNIIIDSIKNYTRFDQRQIDEIARRNSVCPFELSLDLSQFSDIIICDYNYFFDPLVYLKRFFDADSTNNIVLVDEAHNLVERGRSMYSASFNSSKFKFVKKAVKNLEHRKMKNAIKGISKIFNSYDDYEEGETQLLKIDSASLRAIDSFLVASSDVLKHHHSVVTDEFMEFYFDLNKFAKIYEYFDKSFSLYVTKHTKNDITINLLCLDPSEKLKRRFDQVRSKIVFSATLSPTNYYIEMIGGGDKDPLLMLSSPFKKENLHLMIAPKVSLRYKNRDATYLTVFSYLKSFISCKVGNYFIYLPSYEYLDRIRPYLSELDADIYFQEKDMNEEEREYFLSVFVDKPTKTTVGVLIVGGAFGEGIDLVNERLIGVAVVGVGLPQICYERNLIKDYFNKKGENGYDYAYTNPGMNKVLQAVGRVIRSEKDRGVALLIDDRYLSGPYMDLYKTHWSHYEVVMSPEDVEKELNSFWKK